MGVLDRLGQVLNADVGKVLKTDVGDIAKGAAEILKTDVSELVQRRPDPPPVVSGSTTVLRSSEQSQTLGRAPVKITSALVQRDQRESPSGRLLSALLPIVVESFKRDAHHPSGEIADDPVLATYLDGSEIVVVEVGVCWDAEEAIVLLRQRAIHAGDAAKMAPDGRWVIGRGPTGAYFAWTRGSVFFGVLAQSGAAGLVRFVEAFPY
jgi:hypothetical protein